jgi:hypothetical protein
VPEHLLKFIVEFDHALWHRHRMVQARTRIMNQLQAVALNEGLHCKKRLWREHGRQQLEAFRLAPWASRRRRDLLELMDRLNPTIAELSQAIEQEAEKNPAAQCLMTHPSRSNLSGISNPQFQLQLAQQPFEPTGVPARFHPTRTGTARAASSR